MCNVFAENENCLQLCCCLIYNFMDILLSETRQYTLAPPGGPHRTLRTRYTNRLNPGNNRGIRNVRTYVRSVYRGSTLKQLALRQFMTDAVKAASKKPKLWRGASAATPFLTILPTFPLLVYVCRCLSAKPTGVHVYSRRSYVIVTSSALPLIL